MARLSATVTSQALAAAVEAARASVVEVRSGSRGIGAGVIWRSAARAASRASSVIVTNAHVVMGAERGNVQGGLRVVTADGRAFEAEVVASNPQLDLAMIRVGATGLPVAKVGDSTRLRVGELVFAIGNPWGQVGVVTAGTISGLGSITLRGTNRAAHYIRSDVLLAPGNSGGPLLDTTGAVIGINAMIFGGDLGVAIPSHVATEWMAGEPDCPVRLGVGVRVVRLPTRQPGLLVVDVAPDGAAARTLLIGDVVLGVDGEPVADPDRFASAVTRSARARGAVRLNVLRGGAVRDVDVQVDSPSL